VTVCFFSIVGWENVSAISEEVKTPEKTYRTAIIYSITLIGLFYISLVVTVLVVIPSSMFNNNITILSSLLTTCCNPKFGFIGDMISILLLFLTTNAWVLGSSRLMFALSRDGILPGILAKVNKSNGVPVRAVFFQWLIFALIIGILVIWNISDSTLLEVSSLNYMLVYSIVFACGIKYFKDKKIWLLSVFSFIVTAIFLPQNINGLAISFIIGLICWGYTYFNQFKNKLILDEN
jgi:amino acid efflux transporter